MKKIVVAVLVGLALGSIGVANAAGYKNTVSIGYAYTDLSGWLSGNANGANIKYNWEDLDSGLGRWVQLHTPRLMLITMGIR